MLSNLIRAKFSTHTLMLAVSVLAFMANKFFSDPQAAAWLREHWVWRNAYETVFAALLIFGVYKSPTDRPQV